MARRLGGSGLGRGPLGGMPLGGASHSIGSFIGDPSPTVFRKAYIRPRLVATGLYDPNWTEITEFVKRWGSLSWGVDDVRTNRFTHSGVNLNVRNDTGAFNDEDNRSSLWFGYLTRYRTLVKVECGYEAPDGTKLPTDTTQGIFILDGEIPGSARTNTATLKCSSLQSIFDEVRAVDVAGIGSTQSASDIITKIRDHTDGSGVAVFQQFISSGAWTIQTTTADYLLATDTIEDISCWDLMEQLAEAENKVLLINRTGGLEYRSRDARASTSAFDFKGQGFDRMNIISLDDFREPWDKFYTFVRYKYLDADTSTSYVTAGTQTSVSPDNLSWKYGSRVYESESKLTAVTSTAQTIANNIFTELSTVKDECAISTLMAPQVEILDRVTVSYRSYSLTGRVLWDFFDWDSANWAQEGENFELDQQAFKVINKKLDLDRFVTTFKLREI